MNPNTETIIPSTKITIDYTQKQYLRYKKNRGEEKPFKACKECLYILGNCVLCKNADMFFDRENALQDTISEIVINRGRPLVKVAQSTIDNRVATQSRDSNFF